MIPTVTTIRTATATAHLEGMTGTGLLVLPPASSDVADPMPEWVWLPGVGPALTSLSLHDADMGQMMRSLPKGWTFNVDDEVPELEPINGLTVFPLVGPGVVERPTVEELAEADIALRAAVAREGALERKRRYYGENREKELERKRRYYEENREKELERQRRYREENREERLEYARWYREENREYCNWSSSNATRKLQELSLKTATISGRYSQPEDAYIVAKYGVISTIAIAVNMKRTYFSVRSRIGYLRKKGLID
ncbi:MULTISPECIES: hypothetical protein [unclassified Luteococcus]|uniref:hypothetical protein n=1 Tax=unclassified Luteococcus TaxID=2639923 RepID=UPI00313AA145